MGNPVEAVEKAKDKVVETGKKVVEKATNGIGSNVWGLITGVLGSPFRTAGGILKGIYSNTFGNLFGMLATTAGIVAATQIAPDAVLAVPVTAGDKKLGYWLGEGAQESGMIGITKRAAMIAAGTFAAIGAGKGAVNSVLDSGGTKDTPTGKKIGSTAGSIISAGALAFILVKSSGIGFAGSSDSSAKSPDPTPDMPDKTPANTVA